MEKNDKINTPLVFSVILNYNSYDDTVNCIRSLESSNYDNNRIIIVDNASPDGSGMKLKKTFSLPRYTVLLSEDNGGYSAGNNIGVKFALKEGADYILIINNDAIVSSNTIQALVDVLNKNITGGIATCKIFYERTKKLYASAGTISKLLCAVVPLTKENFEKECQVSYLSGCLMLVKSSVFNRAGYFDEKYFMYFEDVEFSIRVGKYFKLIYTPNGVAYHKSGGGDEWYNYSPFYFYYSSRNRTLVFGSNSLMNKLHVIIANSINIIFKITALTFYFATGKTKIYFNQILALWNGFNDGIKNITGRTQGY